MHSNKRYTQKVTPGGEKVLTLQKPVQISKKKKKRKEKKKEKENPE